MKSLPGLAVPWVLRAAPQDFPWAVPSGNPLEQPCFLGRLQTSPRLSLSTLGIALGEIFPDNLFGLFTVCTRLTPHDILSYYSLEVAENDTENLHFPGVSSAAARSPHAPKTWLNSLPPGCVLSPLTVVLSTLIPSLFAEIHSPSLSQTASWRQNSSLFEPYSSLSPYIHAILQVAGREGGGGAGHRHSQYWQGTEQVKSWQVARKQLLDFVRFWRIYLAYHKVDLPVFFLVIHYNVMEHFIEIDPVNSIYAMYSDCIVYREGTVYHVQWVFSVQL